MLPERISKFSLRHHWHIFFILICSSLAIASETSNFIFGSNSFFIVLQKENQALQVRSELYFMWQPLEDASSICRTNSTKECYQIDYVIRYLILILLFICAWRYWRSDSKERQLLDAYQEIFFKSKSTDGAIDTILKVSAEKLIKFRGNDRVSIYKYDPRLTCFFRIGRFSKDPDLSTGGEKRYQKDKGVIHKTWSEGPFSIENLPDPNDLKGFQDSLERHGIGNYTQSELKKMRMKSRCYFSFLVHEVETTQKTAIIIFESETPCRFSKKKLQKFLDSEYGRILEQLVINRQMTINPELEPS